MTLPADLVLSRVRNELALARKELPHELAAGETTRLPVPVDVRLVGSPGPDWVEGRVVDRTEHEFRFVVTAEYPLQKPIVRWKTPIFHPNIMRPQDGGYVCTALLDRWNFRSTLVQFVRAIEVLLASPNPSSPYDTDSCTRAAAHFRRAPYVPGVATAAPPPAPAIRLRPPEDGA
ncbi:MAG TPA: ubiquitin-conjugating enzyme E2 [Candidatus Thermoplasmatota archaeon]|nr:ubiquitin-conjugating enzyme E2 [Candidatus Thermoplasmatota archaeon]